MLRISLFLIIFFSHISLALDCVVLDRYVNDGYEVEGSQQHPCGNTLSMCLTDLSSTKKLSPTWALELSNKGKVIRKWPMPVDAIVWSISGNALFAGYPNYTGHENGWESPNFVKVTANGNVSRQSHISKTEGKSFLCSKLTDIPDLQKSFCFKYKDIETKAPRIISFEPACT